MNTWVLQLTSIETYPVESVYNPIFLKLKYLCLSTSYLAQPKWIPQILQAVTRQLVIQTYNYILMDVLSSFTNFHLKSPEDTTCSYKRHKMSTK